MLLLSLLMTQGRQYFQTFYLTEFHLSRKTNTKIYSKFLLKVKKSSIFVKHGDNANLYSCCLKHGYSKPKCHNLHNVQLIFVYIQRTAKTSFGIFLQTRTMVDGAKFNSHGSGSHFKLT